MSNYLIFKGNSIIITIAIGEIMNIFFASLSALKKILLGLDRIVLKDFTPNTSCSIIVFQYPSLFNLGYSILCHEIAKRKTSIKRNHVNVSDSSINENKSLLKL